MPQKDGRPEKHGGQQKNRTQAKIFPINEGEKKGSARMRRKKQIVLRGEFFEQIAGISK